MQAMQICVKALLIWTISLSSIAATSDMPIKASFDCNKAQSNYENLVCKFRDLAFLDVQLSKSYLQALAYTPEKYEKKNLVTEQRKWLAMISSLLQKQVAHNTAEEELRKLLHNSLEERINVLRNTKSDLGKTIILDNSTESKSVCTKILNEKNIVWEGRNDVEQDRFNLSPPPDFSAPDWEVTGIARYAKFDFLNSGEPSDIYLIDMEGTHIEFTNIIAATSQEDELIEDQVEDFEKFGKLASELTQATPRAGEHIAPKYKSRLYNPSATPIFDGWYTRSQIFLFNKTTYIITKSVNNLGGPTFAVFKPNASGLNVICYYRAFPSIKKNILKTLDKRFKCPHENKEINSALGNTGCQNITVSINLKEWGGIRPVTQECYIAGHTEERNISIGGTNGGVAKKDLWAPLATMTEEGNKSLLLTANEAYVANTNESGVTYYRIINNSLIPTCEVANQISPYSGYKTFNNSEDE